MQIKENVSLAKYTTFKIGGNAEYFSIVKDQFDVLNAYEFAKKRGLHVFFLGGGSNLLVSDRGFKGLVVKIENKGIEIIHENNESLTLKVASGEVWDEVVKFSVNNNWWGLENLSHIPGNSGAIAVQNVGAYGQEASNIIKSVIVFDTQTFEIKEIKQNECKFSYRKSIFNTINKERYIIFYLKLVLSKKISPILSYRDLKNIFVHKIPGIREVRSEIIKIRNSKYPFPEKAKNGNAGSFFKNIILDKARFNLLKTRVFNKYGIQKSDLLQNKVFEDSDWVKIPTAFLLELSGFKGLVSGGAGVNKRQPLVILNKTGKASSYDVLNIARIIRNKIYEKFGIKLEIEPVLIGFKKSELFGII